MTKFDKARVEVGIHESGIKLRVLAGRLGMTTRTLYRKRTKGNWTLDELCQLADILFIPITSFFKSA